MNREWEFTPEQQEVIESLFEDALQQKIPRNRELKDWEPQGLNERHLQMIMMRAAGYHQRVIAKAFGTTDGHVSIIVNHPDAEYLLARLLAMRAADPGDIQRRLANLADPAVDILEDALLGDDPDVVKVAMKKSSLAFKVLEMTGNAAPKKVEGTVKHDHQHRLDASPTQMGAIARALREAKQIKDAEIVQYGAEETQEMMQELASPVGGDEPEGGEGA